jgi:hypothetical protein
VFLTNRAWLIRRFGDRGGTNDYRGQLMWPKTTVCRSDGIFKQHSLRFTGFQDRSG